MSQSISESESQEQDSVIKDTNVGGDLIFAPVQIGTQIETQTILITRTEVTQRQLIKNSPYKGLEKFNFSDHDHFFGRDKLIADLIKRVNHSSLTVVFGASGSGKSSVVRAGLIPKLKESLPQTFYDFIFTPTRDPFNSLYQCLLKDEKDYSFSESEAKIALEAKADTLTQVIRTLKKDEDYWLIFVDQFEELFTICNDSDKRKNFIAGLVKVAKSGNSSVKIVLAMRSDFMEQFSLYPELIEIANQNNIHLVTEMYPDELRQAIEAPAAKHGVVFEEGLVEQIIKEVEGQKGYLPLLQYTLKLLWESECHTLGTNGRPAIEDQTLNKETYTTLEGVRGALQKQVNEIYSSLEQEQQIITKQIFLRLVNISATDSGSRAVSRRAYRSEFISESVEEILNKFIEKKLLVTNSEYSNPEELKGSDSKHLKQYATVEIAHEILLSSWDELKRWLEQEKEAIILKGWLRDETERWQKTRSENESKAQDELLKGSRLAQIVEFRQKDAFKNIGGLSKQEEEFINASAEQRDRLLKQEKERTKRLLTVASITSVVFGGLAIFAGIQGREAQVGQINALSGTSEALLASNQEFDDLNALINSLQAGKKLNQVFLPEAKLRAQVRRTLQTVVYGVKERDRLEQDKGQMISGLSADGRKLANLEQYGFDCSWDNIVCLWDKSGEQMAKFLGSQSEHLDSTTFSPDGSKLITVGITLSPDGLGSHQSPLTLRLWDLKSNKQLAEFKGHQSDVWSVSFSPDGSKIAIAGDEGIRLWDKNGKQIPEFKGGQGRVTHVIFSPDGTKLATVNSSLSVNFDKGGALEGDTNVRLWDLNGKQVAQLKEPQGLVDNVIFSPDGSLLATTGAAQTEDEGIVRLWDLSGNNGSELIGPHGSVIFSPDGRFLAGSGEDSIPRVWDLSGKQLFEFKGHQGEASGVIFSPDSKQLVTKGSDNTIRLWDLNGKEFFQFNGQHEISFGGFSFSPDGSKFATVEEDGNVRLWDLSGKKLAEFKGTNLEWRSSSVIFSPDGNQLAVTGEDSILRLWDIKSGKLLKTESEKSQLRDRSFLLTNKDKDGTVHLWNWEGKELAKLKGLKGEIQTVSLSPNGNKLATVEDDTTHLWDWEGKQLAQFKASDYSMTFSPNGKLLATTDNGTAQLWDLSGKQVAEFKAYPYGVVSISFSPDSKLLATAGLDGIVKLWDLESKLQVAEFNAEQSGQVRDLTFSSDGKLLTIVRNDGIARFWRVEYLDDLMVRGCNWGRNYLENNPKVEDSDKHLCDGIGAQK